MPTIVHGFDWPDRLVVGTIGEPGARTFYLQARTGIRIVTVALEKIQSAQLAEKIEEILDQLDVPAEIPLELVDDSPLDPVDEQFRAGAVSLGWDPSTAQVVIEAYPIVESDDEDADPTDEPTEMLVVRIPVGAARAFAKRTLEVVASGRPLPDDADD
jgi:uncharacterized repeat protein (TIGR03847 family)